MSKKSILLVVICLLIIIGFILCVAAINGKKTIDLTMEVALKMYKVNNPKEDVNAYYRDDSSFGWAEYYKLNGTCKMVSYNKNDGMKITDIISDEKITSYMEKNDEKIMCERNVDDLEIEPEEELIMESVDIKNIGIEGFFELVSYGLRTKVSNDTLNGRECYVLKLEDGQVQYIDKETKLPLRIVYSDGEVTIYTVKFNVVTQEDVKELDNSEYKKVSEEEFDEYFE